MKFGGYRGYSKSPVDKIRTSWRLKTIACLFFGLDNGKNFEVGGLGRRGAYGGRLFEHTHQIFEKKSLKAAKAT